MAMPKSKAHAERVPPPNIPNIFSAAESNDVRALDLALTFYDVNERDAIGMTPLHYAASTRATRTIDRLLSQPGIDATLADQFGRSAATVAFECWAELSDDIVDKLTPLCYPWLRLDA
ncbi:MAG: ankyrin repeat domain-containing protein [Lysobacterales bacterium]